MMLLNVLHALVDKSNINKQLEVYNNQGTPDQVTKCLKHTKARPTR